MVLFAGVALLDLGILDSVLTAGLAGLTPGLAFTLVFLKGTVGATFFTDLTADLTGDFAGGAAEGFAETAEGFAENFFANLANTSLTADFAIQTPSLSHLHCPIIITQQALTTSLATQPVCSTRQTGDFNILRHRSSIFW